tara:strand:+ start:118 stop:366 length:249 start_codon:yes stop_codon:yes gene_type:complete
MTVADLPTVIATMVLAMVAVFFAKKTKKKGPDLFGPPKNVTADAARGSIRQTFEEEVESIQEKLKGKDPAGDLADKGNARSR